MSENVEAVILDGQTVRVEASVTLFVAPRLLALAVALRVFERYPVFDRVTLSAGREETTVSREGIVRHLGPEGFAPLADSARYRQALYEILRSERLEGRE